MRPLVRYSIVIATRNAEKHLERCLVSILRQTYPQYEILVQDCCSTDNTLNIINKCGTLVKWISEPDNGIYDAWNKAVSRATGDWIIFLGADDFLLEANTLAHCHVHIKKIPQDIIFAYGHLIHGEDGKPHAVWGGNLRYAYHNLLTTLSLPFPATFTRLSVLREARFDTSYKIAGDYDMVARLITEDNLAYMPVRITWMEHGGISTNPAHRCQYLEERSRVVLKRILPKAEMLVAASTEHLWD